MAALGRVRLLALIPPTLCFAGMFLVRAYRWQRFVAPVQWLPLRPFVAATLIGFMGNNLLPLRAGEFIRAYALAHLTPLRLSAALATAALERVWDAVVISLLLVWALPSFPLPAELVQASMVMLAVCLVFLGGGWWLVRRVRGAGLPAVLPPRLVAPVHHFIDGLGALHSVSLVVQVFLASLAIWLVLVAYYWLMLRACGFALPLEAALAVTLLTVVGVALPAAPGFIGTFQYATVLALSFFAVPKEEALSFSLIAHIAQFLPVTGAGLIALMRSGLPLWPSRLLPQREGSFS